jgi:hypothetical protein
MILLPYRDMMIGGESAMSIGSVIGDSSRAVALMGYATEKSSISPGSPTVDA